MIIINVTTGINVSTDMAMFCFQ